MSVTLLLYNLKLNFLMFFYQSKQLTEFLNQQLNFVPKFVAMAAGVVRRECT